MIIKQKLNIILAALAFIILFIFIIQNSIGFLGLFDFTKFEFSHKNTYRINISLVNPSIKTLAADSSNQLIIKVEVRNSKGLPVPMARVKLSLDSLLKDAGKCGTIYPSDARTDESGKLLATYTPPELEKEFFTKNKTNINIVAKINGSEKNAVQSIKLVQPPIVFIHGYQAYAYVFENFGEYLKVKGLSTSAFEYKSENGVMEASKNLDAFLEKQKASYLSKGLQIQRFDIIAHSMGGLVARYYACGEDYILKNNVRKIIFISVPQKGSPWASLGAAYFKDKGIRDLIPENALLTKTLPGMINRGLNNTIQVASILGQYDEVVSPESASLDEWNIKTELYSVGENNLNFNNILKGNFSEATNHMSILSNKKVFEKVEALLYEKLPYPLEKN